MLTSPSRLSVQQLDKAYTEDEKTKILEVMNESNDKDLSRYENSIKFYKKKTLICFWHLLHSLLQDHKI